MISLLDRARLDFRCAARGLWRDWRVSIVAVASLGLGIGANATALGILQRLWHVAPPGIRDAPALRRLYVESRESGGKQASSSVFDVPALAAIASKAAVFE